MPSLASWDACRPGTASPRQTGPGCLYRRSDYRRENGTCRAIVHPGGLIRREREIVRIAPVADRGLRSGTSQPAGSAVAPDFAFMLRNRAAVESGPNLMPIENRARERAYGKSSGPGGMRPIGLGPGGRRGRRDHCADKNHPTVGRVPMSLRLAKTAPPRLCFLPGNSAPGGASASGRAAQSASGRERLGRKPRPVSFGRGKNVLVPGLR